MAIDPYWERSSCESRDEYTSRKEKDRKKKSVKPKRSYSMAMLSLEFARLKDYKRFLRKYPLELRPDEQKQIAHYIDECERIFLVATMRDVPAKASDLSIALCAGYKEIETQDFIDIVVQSVFWSIYRASRFATSREFPALDAWATSFQIIAFEATATGAKNQKNKISNFSLQNCDRYWVPLHGSQDLEALVDTAANGGLDVISVIEDISNLLEKSFKNLPQHQMKAKDYRNKNTVSEKK